MKAKELHRDLIFDMVKQSFADYIDYVPDTPLKNEDKFTLDKLINNTTSMIIRRFGSMDELDLKEVLQNGIEGQYDTSLRVLSVPKIYKWFTTYRDQQKKLSHMGNESDYYRHKSEELDPYYKPPATSRGTACLYIMFARLGYFRNELLENLDIHDYEFILKNLPVDFSQKKVIEDWIELTEK